jgi:hypothetical protein
MDRTQRVRDARKIKAQILSSGKVTAAGISHCGSCKVLPGSSFFPSRLRKNEEVFLAMF